MIDTSRLWVYSSKGISDGAYCEYLYRGHRRLSEKLRVVQFNLQNQFIIFNGSLDLPISLRRLKRNQGLPGVFGKPVGTVTLKICRRVRYALEATVCDG